MPARMTESRSSHRFTAIISGQVQGVGFRAFARRYATDLGVRGYVENLADGRVEVVAEGPQDELDVLLVKLRMGPTHADVMTIDVEWGEGGGALPGFHIY